MLNIRKPLLDSFNITLQTKRFRGKINIRRPQPPHFEYAKYLALTKPKIKKPDLKPICDKSINYFPKTLGANVYQNILAKELLSQFKNSRVIAFLHTNPITSEDDLKAKIMFKKENMIYRICGKDTLKLAIQNTPYEAILDYYITHNKIVFSPELNVNKILKILKKFPSLILLFGIVENRFVSKDEFIYWGSIPNIETAQVQLVQTLDSMGSNLVTQLNTHQQALVSNLEERIKQLGEPVEN